MCRQASWAG